YNLPFKLYSCLAKDETRMSRKPIIKSLQLSNLLSFGDNSEVIEFGALNLLIGPNGSGKSNIIEVIDLLRNIPDDLVELILQGGGISNWLWKGNGGIPLASIETAMNIPGLKLPVRYVIKFTERTQRLFIQDESLEEKIHVKSLKTKSSNGERYITYFYH